MSFSCEECGLVLEGDDLRLKEHRISHIMGRWERVRIHAGCASLLKFSDDVSWTDIPFCRAFRNILERFHLALGNCVEPVAYIASEDFAGIRIEGAKRMRSRTALSERAATITHTVIMHATNWRKGCDIYLNDEMTSDVEGPLIVLYRYTPMKADFEPRSDLSALCPACTLQLSGKRDDVYNHLVSCPGIDKPLVSDLEDLPTVDQIMNGKRWKTTVDNIDFDADGKIVPILDVLFDKRLRPTLFASNPPGTPGCRFPSHAQVERVKSKELLSSELPLEPEDVVVTLQHGPDLQDLYMTVSRNPKAHATVRASAILFAVMSSPSSPSSPSSSPQQHVELT